MKNNIPKEGQLYDDKLSDNTYRCAGKSIIKGIWVFMPLDDVDKPKSSNRKTLFLSAKEFKSRMNYVSEL